MDKNMGIDKKSTSPRRRSGKMLVTIIIILLLLAVGAIAYMYLQLRNDNNELRSQLAAKSSEIEAYKTNPQEAARSEVRRYVEEVSKVFTLPEDEEPSVATVNDKTKLQDQQFFAKAENGDITLIYPNAKLAVLYRPSTKQVVNVSSVTLQDEADPTN